MKTAILFSLMLIGIIGASHSQGKKNYGAAAANPPGYDLNKPVKYAMPNDLLEISGIAFNKGDHKLIYAEQDEDGNVYSFHLGDKKMKSVAFGKHGDYEDIAVVNNRIIMLRSDGKLYSLSLSQVNSGSLSDIKDFKDLLPAGEYEGMHADQSANKLYVLTKQPVGQKHDKDCPGFIFNVAVDGNITPAGDFHIDVRKVPGLGSKKKFKFHPSALARNPLTKQWYVLSSVNKLLLVTDENWKVQTAYPLNPGTYVQPEGIVFDSAGNLYISNEGGGIGPGNILMLKYTAGK